MEIVTISVVEAVETVTINVTEGFGSVTNSDATYNATVNVSETLVLPDITHTDTDGTPTILPAQTPMVCTPAACSGADVTNSDNTYNQHVNDGDTLVLPDTVVKNTAGATVLTQPSATNTGVIADSVVTNSDNTFSLNVPAETNPVLADVPNVDSTGATVMTPAMTPFVATPGTPPGEQFYVLFPALYKSTVDMSVDASSAGTYAYEQSANTSSVTYKVNGTPVTMPFTVVNGDTLTVMVVKVDEYCLAVVEITNIAITPYTFTAGNFVSVYPPAHNSTYIKSTSEYSSSFAAHIATNPLSSLINGWTDNQWLAGAGQIGNQRIHIDLYSAHTIRRLIYENSHNFGLYTDTGAQDFTLWGSNSATDFNNLDYFNDGSWTQMSGLSATVFDKHISKDKTDPKYILFQNTTPYRYWCIKIATAAGTQSFGSVGIRRIELQE